MLLQIAVGIYRLQNNGLSLHLTIREAADYVQNINMKRCFVSFYLSFVIYLVWYAIITWLATFANLHTYLNLSLPIYVGLFYKINTRRLCTGTYYFHYVVNIFSQFRFWFVTWHLFRYDNIYNICTSHISLAIYVYQIVIRVFILTSHLELDAIVWLIYSIYNKCIEKPSITILDSVYYWLSNSHLVRSWSDPDQIFFYCL